MLSPTLYQLTTSVRKIKEEFEHLKYSFIAKCSKDHCETMSMLYANTIQSIKGKGIYNHWAASIFHFKEFSIHFSHVYHFQS